MLQRQASRQAGSNTAAPHSIYMYVYNSVVYILNVGSFMFHCGPIAQMHVYSFSLARSHAYTLNSIQHHIYYTLYYIYMVYKYIFVIILYALYTVSLRFERTSLLSTKNLLCSIICLSDNTHVLFQSMCKNFLVCICVILWKEVEKKYHKRK